MRKTAPGVGFRWMARDLQVHLGTLRSGACYSSEDPLDTSRYRANPDALGLLGAPPVRVTCREYHRPDIWTRNSSADFR